MITTIVIMGILLFAIGIFSVNCQNAHVRTAEENTQLHSELYYVKQDLMNIHLMRPNWQVLTDHYNAVIVAHVDKMGNVTCVWREYIDPDDKERTDYVIRCAEEVCDKLNEKI